VNHKGLIAAGAKQALAIANVAGIPISHPTKIWFPEDQFTKLQVAQHYAAVAPRLLPWLDQRLLTAERCPDGIAASCFFEKNFGKDLPASVPTCALPAGSTGKTVHYVVGGAKETLLALVNLGCIAIHIMNCQARSLDQPDWLAFDLDPASGQFCDAAKAANVLRKLLEEQKLRSFPKTTGGRGLHVLVPLRKGPSQEQVRLVARSVSQEMARRSPTIITVAMRKAQRQNRVFSDWLRNAFGQTIVAPYSVRCRPGAPVSAPLHWDEVSPRLDPSEFNIRTIPRRLQAVDPWADFWQHRQGLPGWLTHPLHGGNRTFNSSSPLKGQTK
jgi:bifunctional non-homologous end joining protein LigD